jgi:hypothetical protein
MVTLAVPVFVSMTGKVAVVLTRMLPKATVVRFGVRIPVAGAAGANAAPVTPAQLESPATAASSAMGATRANRPRKLGLRRDFAAGMPIV